MPRQLGEAFVTIGPDSAGFRAKAQADIKKALAGITPTVPVDLELRDKGKFISAAEKAVRIQANLDARQAYAQMITLRRRLQELAGTLARIPIGVDDKDAEAKMAGLQRRLLELAHSMQALSGIDLRGDTTSLLSMHAAVASLEGATDRLTRSAAKSVGAFRAQADAEEAIIRKAQGAIIALSMQKAAEDRAAAGALKSAGASTLLGFAMGRLPPLVTQGNNVMRAFGVTGGFLGNAFGFLGTKLTLFGGLLNKVLPTWATHITVMHVAADLLVELIAVWGGAAIAAGAFGVAASDAVQQIARRMQALHTAADATGLSMYPLTGALEKLHNSVRPQVFQVFGDALVVAKARTGDFQKIVHDTGPVIDQLAGRMTAALTSGHAFDIFTKNAKNSLQGLGTSFGNVFGAIGNILAVVPDYAQKLLSFGVVVTGLIENFTGAIQPVLRWGLAIHGAFIYLGLAATLAAVLYSKGLVPLVTWLFRAAQAAGIYVAGLAAVALGEGDVITTTGLLEAALVALGDVPVLVWVALIGAGIAAIILAFRSGSNAANDFTASIEKSIGQASVAQTLNVLAKSITATRQQLVQSEAAARKYGDAIAHAGGQTVNAGRAGSIASTQLLSLQDAYQKASQSSQAYSAEIVKLQGEQRTFNDHLQAIAKITGSSSSALGVLTAAGITQNQMLDRNAADWAATTAQVLGTLAAFKAMSGTAGELNNDLDVLGRTETDQYKATQQLNQAWSTFISDVTSTQGTFDTVIQGFEVLTSHSGDLKLSLGKLKATFSDTAGSVTLQGRLATATAAVASAQNALNKLQSGGRATALQLQAAQDRLTGAQDRLTVAQLNLSQAQSGGVAAIDALTPAGIALNQAFADQVSNIDKLLASWRTAGLANSLFDQGVRDAIAPLVKYAQGSNEATAQLVALAQEAGYHGPNSMKALTKWLGNTKNATKDLKAITDQATQQEALLTGAMQSQGDFIANTLIGDINNAILAYSGVQKAAANYGTALAQFGRGSVQANQAQLNLVAAIVAAGKASNTSKGQITAMLAKILGISSSDALKLLNQVASGFSITGQQAKTASGAIDKTFLQSLKAIGFSSPGVNKDVTAFSSAILAGGTNSDKTAAARKRLIADLVAAGVQANQAKTFVNNLQGQINALKGKTVGVILTTSGNGQIIIRGTGINQRTINTSTGQVRGPGGHTIAPAKGAYVNVGSTPTADDVLAMVSKGELVVPAHMVRAGLVDHLRGMIPGFSPVSERRMPGFAAGGPVGAITNAVTQVSQAHAQWGQQAAVDFALAAVKAAQAAAAAVIPVAGGGISLPGGNASGGAQAYARSILPAGWSWPALVALWNQECLDTASTQILTKRGWLAHDEVRVGDETIGYNPVTGRSEWTRVTRVVHYDDAELWQIGHSRWHARATPGHRWWSDYRRDNGRGYVIERQGFVKTSEFSRGDRLRLAAPADTDGIPGLSADDVAILAWLQGDGYIKPVRERSETRCPECDWIPASSAHVQFRVALHRRTHGVSKSTVVTGHDGCIYQSKPAQIVRIRALLAHTDHSESIVTPRGRGRREQPEHVFLLRRGYVTDLVKRSEVMERGPAQLVLRMSPDQRAAWLTAMIDAEGSQRDGHTVICQNRGDLHDAIILAGYLEGFQVTVHADGRGSASQIGLCEPHITAGSLGIEVLGRQPVWCVTTSLGTWTARQDGQVFLTGNSGWNPNAVNASSGAYGIPQALPAAWDHPYALGDFVSQIRWGLGYIAGRYGSSQAAWAHEQSFNWYKQGGLVGSTYDKGGVLPPWGVGVNTSGKAEMVSPAQGPGSLHETNLLLRQMTTAIRENTQVTAAQGQAFAHGIGTATARGSIRGYYGG